MSTVVTQSGTPKKGYLQTVNLADIRISTTNPRKRFDENALAELSQSVAAHGVLQPILIRPTADPGKYELVCGERRYRASTMAGLDEIPANIRELNDEEAFELQIIENLERKDVHPLDEADAFQRMLDSGRYQVEDIAAKMAKPVSFILNRLKLNELIPEVKQDFFDGICNIGHAVLIAKLDPEQQADIYKNYKDNDVHGYGTRQDLVDEIAESTLELTGAPFSLDVIFPHAGPCEGCAFRTINNPVLFEEFNDEDNCMKKTCYNAKVNHHVNSQFQDIIESGKDILVGRDYYSFPDDIKQIADDNKVKVLREYDDYYTSERIGYVKKPMLSVAGREKGKIIDVWVPSGSAAANGKTIAQEIKDIETKAARALELDQEKIHRAIIEALRPEVESKRAKDLHIPDDVMTAVLLYFTIESVGFWEMRPILNKLSIKIDQHTKNFEDHLHAVSDMTPEQKEQLIIIIMFMKGIKSINKDGFYGQLIRTLAKHNPTIDVAAIESRQQEVAEKRIAKTEARLAELRAQLPVVADRVKPAKAKTR